MGKNFSEAELQKEFLDRAKNGFDDIKIVQMLENIEVRIANKSPLEDSVTAFIEKVKKKRDELHDIMLYQESMNSSVEWFKCMRPDIDFDNITKEQSDLFEEYMREHDKGAVVREQIASKYDKNYFNTKLKMVCDAKSKFYALEWVISGDVSISI